jgi:hypothetical protein
VSKLLEENDVTGGGIGGEEMVRDGAMSIYGGMYPPLYIKFSHDVNNYIAGSETV